MTTKINPGYRFSKLTTDYLMADYILNGTCPPCSVCEYHGACQNLNFNEFYKLDDDRCIEGVVRHFRQQSKILRGTRN